MTTTLNLDSGTPPHNAPHILNTALVMGTEETSKDMKGFSAARGRIQIPLVLLGLALLIVNLGFGMFTPILPQYANLLGIDATVLSYVYSLYNVALIVCLIPAGVMADRLGRVKTIVIGMILFAVSLLMLAFVKDLTQFAIARTIEGVGSALAPGCFRVNRQSGAN